MKGYWVVAVRDVIKPDAWEQVLSSWGNYVEKSNGIVNPISFSAPKAVYESGIEKTTAVIEFPSLDQAVHARTEDPDYYQGVIEADGTPVENKVIRDFRIIEVEDGWMKPGHGYWLVWVREFKDKDSWLEKVMPAWQEYVASGACKVHHLKPPHMAMAKHDVERQGEGDVDVGGDPQGTTQNQPQTIQIHFRTIPEPVPRRCLSSRKRCPAPSDIGQTCSETLG